jgi:CheY-like chemotaxis protein
MARILICEPHDDVRRLLERMVARLGHEPIVATIPGPEHLTSADVFILEPAEPVGAVFAQAASLAVPELPLICSSVAAPPRELADLDVQFAAYLIKPYTVEQLRVAIEQALRS